MLRIISILLLVASIGKSEQPWSIVQVGDIHAGSMLGGIADWTAFQSFILSHTNDGVFNIKAVVSAGDLYEQDYPISSQATNVFSGLTAFRDAGIFTFMCPGNHDCDDPSAASQGSRICQPGAEWNNYFGTNWYMTYPGYKGTRLTNDTKNVAVTWTNSGAKMLFISLTWATNLAQQGATINAVTRSNIVAAYADQVHWATNQMGLFPDHLAVVLPHYMISTNRDYDYWDTGFTLYTNVGLAQAFWDNMTGIPSNLWLVLAGHNRVPLKINRFFKNDSGNWGCVQQWNTQNYSNYTQMFALITILPDSKKVLFRSYDIYSGTWLTNGQTHYFGSTPRQWNHNWQMDLPTVSTPRTRAFRLQ